MSKPITEGVGFILLCQRPILWGQCERQQTRAAEISLVACSEAGLKELSLSRLKKIQPVVLGHCGYITHIL